MKKKEILEALAESRKKILQAVEGLGDEEMLEPGVIDTWSVKDLLFHMTMWEAEQIKLLWQASQGQTPSTIHFSGTSTDDINADWEAQALSRDLAQVWEDFRSVRPQTIRRVNELNDSDFEDIHLFAWLKGQPLWVWIAEDTFKHETEHAGQILAWRTAKGL